MTAEQAKQAAIAARDNAAKSIGPRIFSRIQDESAKGKNFLLCRSNKQVSDTLKAHGFRCILFFNIALIWW